MADHDDETPSDPTPDDAEASGGETTAPETEAEDGTETECEDGTETEGEDRAEAEDSPDGEDRAEGEDQAGEADGEAGRPRWVVPFLLGVVAVVAVVLGVVALVGGDDGDDGGSGDDAAAEDAGGDGSGTGDEPAGTTVPPVTTAAGTPTAGLLSELPPVGDAGWEPAGDDVTIGGATYAETVVSGPIGTCEDGAARTVTYDLAGGYTWLEGVVGLVDGTATGLTVEIGFEADGEQVWWKTLAEGEASRVQLDVTGARELTVTATGLFPGVDAAEACVRAAYGDLTLR